MHLLPDHGMAVDLAGGDGGAALELAGRGNQAALVEVSDVAIERAEAAAGRRPGSAAGRFTGVNFDLADRTLGHALAAVAAAGAGPDSKSSAAVTVVTCFHYLNRTILRSVAADLPPGAVFAAAIATTTNLERHPRPSARFLLDPGELRELVIGRSDLEVVHWAEGWVRTGHHEAELVVGR
jgi:hypothetical protein